MTAYRSLSVATLVRGRQCHFDHLVAGLAAQQMAPDELVVAYMQESPPQLYPRLPFPVRFVHVPGEDLPLAAARNAAATAAAGEILAFLDVDCIPDRHFVVRAREASDARPKTVFLPEVRYLPASASGWLELNVPDRPALERAGQRHPAKPDLSSIDIAPVKDYGELWGLAFVIDRQDWFAAGGMDEAYVGYGGEETDFAQRLRCAKISLHWLGGTICYHQHHAVHIPPLQHFAAIVRNAQIYRSHWGSWCMTYWLDEFERRGYIRKFGETIEVLAWPTRREIDACMQGPGVLFS